MLAVEGQAHEDAAPASAFRILVRGAGACHDLPVGPVFVLVPLQNGQGIRTRPGVGGYHRPPRGADGQAEGARPGRALFAERRDDPPAWKNGRPRAAQRRPAAGRGGVPLGQQNGAQREESKAGAHGHAFMISEPRERNGPAAGERTVNVLTIRLVFSRVGKQFHYSILLV